MSSTSKKRKLSDFLAHQNTPTPPPTFTVPTVSGDNKSWSTLTQQAVNSRALITTHSYMNATTQNLGQVSLSHTHGEFNKKVGQQIDTHNISTSDHGSSPQSFPKIINRMDQAVGAVDALRVVKGTHLSKGLTSSTVDERKAAVELGVEIGISEYSRGTNLALTDASINLYRIKHAKIGLSDFSDHTAAYSGAGKGGAKRLRDLGDVENVFSQYQTDLRDIYDTHASKKADIKRTWEQGLGSKADDDTKYSAWQYHKFQRWTRRE